MEVEVEFRDPPPILYRQLIKYNSLGEVVLLGDFNSCTGFEPDFLSDDHSGNKHIFANSESLGEIRYL